MFERKIKITFIGNQGVGKTCIISRYIYNEFPENPNNIVVANYLEKKIQKNNVNIKLDIWNSIGNEKFQDFGKYFYEDSNIICFVYDITDFESFNNIKNVWYPQFQQNGDKNAIIGIVGNKSDLYEIEIFELENEAKKFAENIGALFMIISAKTGNGIQKLFDNFVDLYLGHSNIKENKYKDNDKNINNEDFIDNVNDNYNESDFIIENFCENNNINIIDDYIKINKNTEKFNNKNDNINEINEDNNENLINNIKNDDINEINNNNEILINNENNGNINNIINNNDSLINNKNNNDINEINNNNDILVNNGNINDIINNNYNLINNNNNNNMNRQRNRGSKINCLCF